MEIRDPKTERLISFVVKFVNSEVQVLIGDKLRNHRICFYLYNGFIVVLTYLQ